MIVCGVDEAGRGSMMGPLVIAGVAMNHTNLEELASMGVRDSKKLTPLSRERLYKKIINLAERHAIVRISPKIIDRYVAKHHLNRLEARYMAKVIDKLQPDETFVDSCDVNPARFTQELGSLCQSKRIRSFHRADQDFIIVSAASILAKVARDRAIKRLHSEGQPGSGYPSDSRTVVFVKEWFEKNGSVPNYVRKSWAPVKKMIGVQVG